MADIRLDADAQAALREIHDLVDGINEIGLKTDETTEKTKKAAGEERRLGNLRNRLLRLTETAQEKYTRRLNEATAALRGQGETSERIGRVRDRITADYQADLEKERRALEENNEELGETEEGVTGAFGPAALTKIGAFVGGVVSVRSALALVTKELEAQQDRFDELTETQITLDQSRAGVRRNLVGASSETIENIQGQATALSDLSGISEIQINRALADALSASGGKIAASVDAVTEAASFSRDTPESISLIAGTLLDLAKATGTDDAKVNLGFLATLGSAGRVVDPKLQASNLAPGVIGTLAFGGDANTSAAALAALTNAGADATGARSATSIVSLAKQLQEFDESKEGFDNPKLQIEVARASAGIERARKSEQQAQTALERIQRDNNSANARQSSLPRTEAQRNSAAKRADRLADAEARLAAAREKTAEATRVESQAAAQLARSTQAGNATAQAFRNADTLLERLRLIQSSPALQDDFLANASFETGVAGQIKGLLTDSSSDAAREFEKNLGLFGNRQSLSRTADEVVRKLDVANPLSRTAAFDRVLNRAVESQRSKSATNNLSRGQISSIEEILQRNGAFASETEFESFTSRLDGDGVTFQDGIGLLNRRANRLENGPGASLLTTGGTTVRTPGRFATEGERESAAVLRTIAEKLGSVVENSAAQVEETRLQTEEIRNGAGIPVQ